MTGLPNTTTACLFDMDGVLTATAELHRLAWRETFDAVLRELGRGDESFTEDDYFAYVDGRPRSDGVRTFLQSRQINLPEGAPDDPSDVHTVHGIGRRKNEVLWRLLEQHGVRVYPGSHRYLEAVRSAGLPIGVVTSSANGEEILAATGLRELVSTVIDGKVIERGGLRGKPEPDSFIAGARALGLEPSGVAIFEDALSGVQAGRAGGFGCVVGVDRNGQEDVLRDNGADVVVHDLAELLDGDRR